MEVTIGDDDRPEVPQQASQLIVRDATSVETAVDHPAQMPHPTKVVDAQDPEVQRGIREGSIEVVGTVERNTRPERSRSR